MKRACSNSGESKSRKQPKFEGKRADIEAFLVYVKSLKVLIDESPVLESSILGAICKQLQKHLAGDRIIHYGMEQVCSRNVEYVLRLTSSHILALESSEADTVARLVSLFSQLVDVLGTEDHCVRLAENQYGSHTLEVIIEIVKQIRKSSGSLDDFHKKCERMVGATFDDLNRLTRLMTHPAATHYIRRICDLIDSELASPFLRACRGLFANIGQVTDKLYCNEQSSPTLQRIIGKYLALEPDAKLRAEFKEKCLPVEKVVEYAQQSPPANRMIEFLISEDLCDSAQAKLLAARLMKSGDLVALLRTPARYIIMALLTRKLLSQEQLAALIGGLEVGRHTKLVLALIESAANNKIRARALIEKLKEHVCDKHGVRIDWTRRVTDFKQGKLHELKINENFWYLLLTQPPADQVILSYEGSLIACALIQTFRAGYLTTELVFEFERLLFPTKQGSEFLKQLLAVKRGVFLLQYLMEARVSEMLKVSIRRYVLDNLDNLVFNEYASFLVAAITAASSQRQLAAFRAKLRPLASEIRLRNFALYKHAIEPMLAKEERNDRFGGVKAR